MSDKARDAEKIQMVFLHETLDRFTLPSSQHEVNFNEDWAAQIVELHDVNICRICLFVCEIDLPKATTANGFTCNKAGQLI